MQQSLTVSTNNSELSNDSICSPIMVPESVKPEAKAQQITFERRNKMRIEGHRGAGSLEPENTLKAFQRAIDMGFDGIELDVWISVDGIPIVTHGTDEGLVYFKDSTLDTFAYLLDSKNLKTWVLKNDETIPTLEEVLTLCKDKIRVNIEFKEENERVVKPTLKLVQTMGMLDQVHFSSFLHKHKDRLNEAKLELGISQAIEFDFLVWQFDGFGEWKSRAQEGDALTIDMDLLDKDEEFIMREIQEVRKLKLKLKFYFCFHRVEDDEVYKKLDEMMADTLIVNQPHNGIAFLRQAVSS